MIHGVDEVESEDTNELSLKVKEDQNWNCLIKHHSVDVTGQSLKEKILLIL